MQALSDATKRKDREIVRDAWRNPHYYWCDECRGLFEPTKRAKRRHARRCNGEMRSVIYWARDRWPRHQNKG